MRIARVVAPTINVVSLDEVKLHLRIDHDDEDDMLQLLVDSVTSSLDGVDGLLGRALATATYEATLTRWEEEIALPLPPLQSVESINVWGSDGLVLAVLPSDYIVIAGEVGSIRRTGLNSWPTPFDRPDAITIRFVAGYGTAEEIPAPIRLAILQRIGTAYEQRESSILATAAFRQPDFSAFDALLPYRVIGFGA